MESADTRILVVEDDPDFNLILCDFLGFTGMTVVSCADGATALETLAHHKFDLVLADIRMPEMSGIELIRAMRARGDLTGVVVLTGFGDQESAIAALRLGAVDFLEKPVKGEVLTSRVHRALEIGRREREIPIDEELNCRLVGLLRAGNAK